MANRYSQIFTLTDIFNNKRLQKKLPLVNYKEKELENGKTSQRTNVMSVRKRVFDTATNAASPYYSPLRTQRIENQLIIGGELVGDYNDAVDAIYNSIKAIRSVLLWTANNADMVRYALKEAERHKRNFGIDCKLYLRAQSMQEIEGMNKQQLQALLENVMENIIFGDDFPETQRKFEVDKLLKGGYNYRQQMENWRQKVGAL